MKQKPKVNTIKILNDKDAMLSTGCSVKYLMEQLDHLVLESINGNSYFFKSEDITNFIVNELALDRQKTRKKHPNFPKPKLTELEDLKSNLSNKNDLSIKNTSNLLEKVLQGALTDDNVLCNNKSKNCAACNDLLEENRGNFYFSKNMASGFNNVCIPCYKAFDTINRKLRKEIKSGTLNLTKKGLDSKRKYLYNQYLRNKEIIAQSQTSETKYPLLNNLNVSDAMFVKPIHQDEVLIQDQEIKPIEVNTKPSKANKIAKQSKASKKEKESISKPATALIGLSIELL